MFRCTMLALVLLSGSLFAAPPKLDVPKEVKGDACDWIVVPAVTDAVSVKWIAVDPVIKFFPVDKLKDQRECVVSVKTPGKYTLIGVGANDKGEQTVTTTVLVVGGEKKPDVGPTPKPIEPTPNPKPDDPPPTPVASARITVVVVEETADASIQRAKFFDDKALSDKITAKGHKVIAIDKDIKDKDGNVPARLVGYLNEAKGKGLPWVVMVDTTTAKIVYSGAMPNDPAKALELLIKYGGN